MHDEIDSIRIEGVMLNAMPKKETCNQNLLKY